MDFGQVPEEVLLQILSLVEARDLIPLQTVCRSLYSSITSNYSRLKRLKLSRDVWIRWDNNDIGFFCSPILRDAPERPSVVFNIVFSRAEEEEEEEEPSRKRSRREIERFFRITDGLVTVEGFTIWAKNAKCRSYEVTCSNTDPFKGVELLTELIKTRIEVWRVLVEFSNDSNLLSIAPKFRRIKRIFIGGRHSEEILEKFLQVSTPFFLSVHLHAEEKEQDEGILELRDDFFTSESVKSLRTLEFNEAVLPFIFSTETLTDFKPTTLRYCYTTQEVLKATVTQWFNMDREIKAWTMFIIQDQIVDYDLWRGVQESTLKEMSSKLSRVEHYTPSFLEKNPITGEWEIFHTDFSCMRVTRSDGVVLECRAEYSRSADRHARCERPCGSGRIVKCLEIPILERRNLLPVIRIELFVPHFRHRDFVEES